MTEVMPPGGSHFSSGPLTNSWVFLPENPQSCGRQALHPQQSPSSEVQKRSLELTDGIVANILSEQANQKEQPKVKLQAEPQNRTKNNATPQGNAASILPEDEEMMKSFPLLNEDSKEGDGHFINGAATINIIEDYSGPQGNAASILPEDEEMMKSFPLLNEDSKEGDGHFINGATTLNVIEDYAEPQTHTISVLPEDEEMMKSFILLEDDQEVVTQVQEFEEDDSGYSGATASQIMGTFHEFKPASDEEVRDAKNDRIIAEFEEVPGYSIGERAINRVMGFFAESDEPKVKSFNHNKAVVFEDYEGEERVEGPEVRNVMHIMPTREDWKWSINIGAGLAGKVVSYLPGSLGERAQLKVENAAKQGRKDVDTVANAHDQVVEKTQSAWAAIKDAFKTSYWDSKYLYYGELSPEEYAKGPTHHSVGEQAADAGRRYGLPLLAGAITSYLGLNWRGAAIAAAAAAPELDQATGDMAFAGLFGARFGVANGVGAALDLQGLSWTQRQIARLTRNQFTTNYVLFPMDVVTGAFSSLYKQAKGKLNDRRIDQLIENEFELVEDIGLDGSHILAPDDRNFIRRGYDDARYHVRPYIDGAVNGVREHGGTAARIGLLAAVGSWFSLPVAGMIAVGVNSPENVRRRVGAATAQVVNPIFNVLSMPFGFIPGGGLLARLGMRRAMQNEHVQNGLLHAAGNVAGQAPRAATLTGRFFSWIGFRREQAQNREDFANLENYANDQAHQV